MSEAASTAAIHVRTSIPRRRPGRSTPRWRRICSAAARRTSSTIAVVCGVSTTLPPRSRALNPASYSSTKTR